MTDEPRYCPTCGRPCVVGRVFGDVEAEVLLCWHCTPADWALVDETDGGDEHGDELDDALAAELRALLGEE